MPTLLRTPVTVVWLLLMAATAGSLWIAVDHGIGDAAVATVAVIVVAMIKVRFVGMYFMELRHAPFLLRAAFNGWCVLCFVAIVGVYVLGR